VLLKYDSNLKNARLRLVPDEVDEEKFWRNYFYKIECYKTELGLPSMLGDRIDHDQRRLLEQ